MQVVGILTQTFTQLFHLVPPLVGLVLVLRRQDAGRWRQWAVALFGVSLAAGVFGLVVQLLLVTGRVAIGPNGLLFALLNVVVFLLSLAVSVLTVVAVLADRRPSPSA